MGTPYQYRHTVPNFYEEHYDDVSILTSYDDILIPTLVPPEEYLVPQLVPPPKSRKITRAPRTSLQRPNSPLPIEIIEFPVLVEVPVQQPGLQPQQQQIPQYILNGYIDSLVAKKETCPILLTELALETTCITPCGHALSKEGLDSWFATSQTCPVCRSACLKEQLQVWKS